jgi:RNA polymerase sigma-70 factor (ECF subfamily)
MDWSQQSDERLMQLVASGQREPLTILLRPHANGVLTFLVRMLGDRARGEELFQDVFLAVWTARQTYRFPRPFRAWLFGIAANHCRNERRQRERRPVTVDPLTLDAGVGASDSPMAGAVATETRLIVEDAVTTLPTQQRTAVVLRVWNGCSFAEIAESLGCTEATARSHLSLALGTLRRCLEPKLRE